MKKNIGVFFGGVSVEHQISIISALQVIKAIDKSVFDVTPVYISQDGEWYTGNWLMYLDNFKNFKTLLKNCKKIIPSLNSKEGLLISYPAGLIKTASVVAKIDIAFPVFHGTNGEDGCFQGVFEIMDIPYVGSNVLASSICMNKYIAKTICSSIGIPVVQSHLIDADKWFRSKNEELSIIENKFKYPLIVKPNDLGSSIGIGKATNSNELVDSIELAATFSNNIIVEPCISNLKEVNCSVMASEDEIRISECEEPVLLNANFLSFDEKYLSSESANTGMAGTKRKIPAEISMDKKKEVTEYSSRIYRHLGCSGVVRIDFMIDLETDNVYLNEINSIPGSLAFYLWEASGYSFSNLISVLIKNAEKEYTRRQKIRKNYNTNVLFKLDGSKLSGKL